MENQQEIYPTAAKRGSSRRASHGEPSSSGKQSETSQCNSSRSFRSPTCLKRHARESCVNYRLESPEFAAPIEDPNCWRGCKQNFSSWGNATVPPLQRVPFNPMEVGAHLGLYSPSTGTLPVSYAANPAELGLGPPGFLTTGPRESIAGAQYLASRPVRFSHLWNSPTDGPPGKPHHYSPAEHPHERSMREYGSGQAPAQYMPVQNYAYTFGDARRSNPDPMDEFGSSYQYQRAPASAPVSERHQHRSRSSSKHVKESQSWTHGPKVNRASRPRVPDVPAYGYSSRNSTCDSLCGHHTWGSRERSVCSASCMRESAQLASAQHSPPRQYTQLSQAGSPEKRRSRSSPPLQRRSSSRHSEEDDDGLNKAHKFLQAATEYLSEHEQRLSMDRNLRSPSANIEREKISKIKSLLAVVEDLMENRPSMSSISRLESHTKVEPSQSFSEKTRYQTQPIQVWSQQEDEDPTKVEASEDRPTFESDDDLPYGETKHTKSSGGGEAMLKSIVKSKGLAGSRGVRFFGISENQAPSNHSFTCSASSAADLSMSKTSGGWLHERLSEETNYWAADVAPVPIHPWAPRALMDDQGGNSTSDDTTRDDSSSRKSTFPLQQQTDSDMYNEFPDVNIHYGAVEHQDAVRNEAQKRVAHLKMADKQKCLQALEKTSLDCKRNNQHNTFCREVLAGIEHILRSEKSHDDDINKPISVEKKPKWDDPTSAQSSGTRTEQTISPHIIADDAAKVKYVTEELERFVKFMSVIEEWKVKSGPSGSEGPPKEQREESSKDGGEQKAPGSGSSSKDRSPFDINPYDDDSGRRRGESDPPSRQPDKSNAEGSELKDSGPSLTSLLRQSLEAALTNPDDETVFMDQTGQSVDNVIMLLDKLNRAAGDVEESSEDDHDVEEDSQNATLRTSLASALLDPFGDDSKLQEPVVESAYNAVMLLHNLDKAVDSYASSLEEYTISEEADEEPEAEVKKAEDEDAFRRVVDGLGSKLKHSLKSMQHQAQDATPVELTKSDLKALLDILDLETDLTASQDGTASRSLHNTSIDRTPSGAIDAQQWSPKGEDAKVAKSSDTSTRADATTTGATVSSSASSVVSHLLDGWLSSAPTKRPCMNNKPAAGKTQEVSLNLTGVKFLLEALEDHLYDMDDHAIDSKATQELKMLLKVLQRIERHAVRDHASDDDHIFTVHVAEQLGEESGLSDNDQQAAAASTLPPLKKQEQREILTSWHLDKSESRATPSPMLSKVEMPANYTGPRTTADIIASSANSIADSPTHGSAYHQPSFRITSLSSSPYSKQPAETPTTQTMTQPRQADQSEVVFQFGKDKGVKQLAKEMRKLKTYSPVFGYISPDASMRAQKGSSRTSRAITAQESKEHSTIEEILYQAEIPPVEEESFSKIPEAVASSMPLNIDNEQRDQLDRALFSPKSQRSLTMHETDESLASPPTTAGSEERMVVQRGMSKPDAFENLQQQDSQSQLEPCPPGTVQREGDQVSDLVQSLMKVPPHCVPAAFEPCKNCTEPALPTVDLEEERLEKASSLNQESQFPIVGLGDKVERGLVLPSTKEQPKVPEEEQLPAAADTNRFRRDLTSLLPAEADSGETTEEERIKYTRAVEDLFTAPSKQLSKEESLDFMVQSLKMPRKVVPDDDDEPTSDSNDSDQEAGKGFGSNNAGLKPSPPSPSAFMSTTSPSPKVLQGQQAPSLSADEQRVTTSDGRAIAYDEEPTIPEPTFPALSPEVLANLRIPGLNLQRSSSLELAEKVNESPAANPRPEEPVAADKSRPQVPSYPNIWGDEEPEERAIAYAEEPTIPEPTLPAISPGTLASLEIPGLSLQRTSSLQLAEKKESPEEEPSSVEKLDQAPEVHSLPDIMAQESPSSVQPEEFVEPEEEQLKDLVPPTNKAVSPAEERAIAYAEEPTIPDSTLPALSPETLASLKIPGLTIQRTSSLDLAEKKEPSGADPVPEEVTEPEELVQPTDIAEPEKSIQPEEIEIPREDVLHASSSLALVQPGVKEPSVPASAVRDLSDAAIKRTPIQLEQSSSLDLVAEDIPRREVDEDVDSLQTLSDPDVIGAAKMSSRDISLDRDRKLPADLDFAEANPDELAEAFGVKEEEATFASWQAEQPEMAQPVNEDVLLVARAIFHHLKCLKSNTFSLPEVTLKNGDFNSAETNDFVRAIAPATSLFNHSCCPNAAWDFIDGKVVCRILRPVKKGEEVTLSYGYNFHNYPEKERREALKDSYCFICKCEACSNHYKTFQEAVGQPIVLKCPECQQPGLPDNCICTSCGVNAKPWIEALDQSNIEYVAKHQGINKDNFIDAIPVLEQHIMNLDALVPRDAAEYVLPLELLRKCYLMQGYVHDIGPSCRP